MAHEIFRLFAARNVLPLLGRALVESIRALQLRPSSETVGLWYQAWKEAGAKSPDLQLPLRLLGTAAQFYRTQDQRVLLELPAEERRILDPLLDSKES